ncbi:MAG: hypothetical protein J6B43_02780 [Lachnospiraceae bacterium]|nr:hypothetical protein [Lachnospiraceae bacterium]
MWKRKQKALISILAAVVIVIGILSVWYFFPKTFLDGIEAGDVKSISVFDGNTGKSFHIDAPEEIQYIVENIQGIEMERDNISVNYSGYSFRMSFYGENAKVLDRFIINSADTIRCDPFFYRCDGGLCYDYLRELENKYAD